MMFPSKMYVILPVVIAIMIGMVGSFTPSPITKISKQLHQQQTPLMMASKEGNEDEEKANVEEFLRGDNTEELVKLFNDKISSFYTEGLLDAQCTTTCKVYPRGSGQREACCTLYCSSANDFHECMNK